jgi:hypothetical protein
VIALRQKIERGVANPWLRPFVLLLLALLLAFVFLHAAHDSSAAADEMGLCLGIVIVLSAILLDLAAIIPPPTLVPMWLGRAPPRPPRLHTQPSHPPPILIPLRR